MLTYNYVTLKSPQAGRVLQDWQVKKLLETAITELHENGEKIISVVPMKFGITGDLEEALVVTEIGS
jgi:hypothetical protein